MLRKIGKHRDFEDLGVLKRSSFRIGTYIIPGSLAPPNLKGYLIVDGVVFELVG